MAQLTIQQALNLALQHHQAGALAQAEQMYRQVLANQPNHPDALHLLGVLAGQVGRGDVAVDLMGRAVALRPDDAVIHSNLGNALAGAGRWEEAVAACRRAIALAPELPEAHSNLGNALKGRGQVDQAAAAYRRAIALAPGFADAYCNLGRALMVLGGLDEAIAAYRRAIALAPGFADAHCNLGNALLDKGEVDEAIGAYRRAIALKGDFAEAHGNLANALKVLGRLDEAIAACRQAIALKPQLAQAHCSLGNALKEKGQLDGAVASYRQAVALKPHLADAHCNLGNALKDQGQLDEAIASYRQAVALKSDAAGMHSNLVYSLHFHPGYDAAAIAEEHRRWNRAHAQPLAPGIRPHPNDRSPDRRLRIGYVSPDFRDHVVGRNLLPLFRQHSHELFEVFGYIDVFRPDAITQAFGGYCDTWRSIVGQGDAAVAELVRQDRIDILVDLALHMAGNRLLVFARKPAPVQVTFAGYPASTGLSTIDYRLTDPYLDPPGLNDAYYSEKPYRFGDSFWCYDPPSEEPLVNALPAATNGWITFGCLNNFCKINEPTLRLWGQVLRAVDRSRLVLLTGSGAHRQRTVDLLHQEGISPERVEFFFPRPRPRYLELYHGVDLALDSFPYNGHTTSLDACWMGVPVVSLVGTTAVSRAGWSQLSNLGLTELVATGPEQFVEIAVKLTGDLPRLAAMRQGLRQRMRRSPLMDAARFAGHIEAAYRQMWRTWCSTPSS